MKKFLLASCGAAALALAATGAKADNGDYWPPSMYVAVAGGVEFLPTTDHSFPDIAVLQQYDFKTGYAIQGTVGAYLPHNFRGELELTYRDSKTEDTVQGNTNTPPIPGGGGGISSTTVMANILYAVPVTERIDIFAGGGIGVAFVDFNVISAPTNFVLGRGNDTRFAYQLIVGASVDVTERAAVFAKYSYLGTAGDSMTTFNSGVGTFARSWTYDSHTIFGGVKFKLGQM